MAWVGLERAEHDLDAPGGRTAVTTFHELERQSIRNRPFIAYRKAAPKRVLSFVRLRSAESGRFKSIPQKRLFPLSITIRLTVLNTGRR